MYGLRTRACYWVVHMSVRLCRAAGICILQKVAKSAEDIEEHGIDLSELADVVQRRVRDEVESLALSLVVYEGTTTRKPSGVPKP